MSDGQMVTEVSLVSSDECCIKCRTPAVKLKRTRLANDISYTALKESMMHLLTAGGGDVSAPKFALHYVFEGKEISLESDNDWENAKLDLLGSDLVQIIVTLRVPKNDTSSATAIQDAAPSALPERKERVKQKGRRVSIMTGLPVDLASQKSTQAVEGWLHVKKDDSIAQKLNIFSRWTKVYVVLDKKQSQFAYYSKKLELQPVKLEDRVRAIPLGLITDCKIGEKSDEFVITTDSLTLQFNASSSPEVALRWTESIRSAIAVWRMEKQVMNRLKASQDVTLQDVEAVISSAHSAHEQTPSDQQRHLTNKDDMAAYVNIKKESVIGGNNTKWNKLFVSMNPTTLALDLFKKEADRFGKPITQINFASMVSVCASKLNPLVFLLYLEGADIELFEMKTVEECEQWVQYISTKITSSFIMKKHFTQEDDVMATTVKNKIEEIVTNQTYQTPVVHFHTFVHVLGSLFWSKRWLVLEQFDVGNIQHYRLAYFKEPEHHTKLAPLGVIDLKDIVECLLEGNESDPKNGRFQVVAGKQHIYHYDAGGNSTLKLERKLTSPHRKRNPSTPMDNERLPLTVVVRILAFLEREDMTSVTLVCSMWNATALFMWDMGWRFCEVRNEGWAQDHPHSDWKAVAARNNEISIQEIIETLMDEQEEADEELEDEDMSSVSENELDGEDETNIPRCESAEPVVDPLEVIVIDSGTYCIKAGVVNDKFKPSVQLVAALGLLKSGQTFTTLCGQQIKPPMPVFGNDMLSMSGAIQTQKSVSKFDHINVNLGVDFKHEFYWEDLESCYEHILMGIVDGDKDKLAAHPVVLTVPDRYTAKDIENIKHMFFMKFGITSLYVTPASPLAAYSYGRVSCLVVDLGYSSLRITPIVHGVILESKRLFTHLGGQEIRDLFARHLSKQHARSSFALLPPLIRGAIAQDILHRLSFCSQTHAHYQFISSSSDAQHPYSLPPLALFDKRGDQASSREVSTMHLSGVDMNFCGEYLFNPQDFSSDPELKGLPYFIGQVIDSCDIDVRTMLWSNICLCGGLSLMPGLSHRLTNELLRFKTKDSVNICVEQDRDLSNWQGGAILSVLEEMEGNWLRKWEWEERMQYDSGKSPHSLEETIRADYFHSNPGLLQP